MTDHVQPNWSGAPDWAQWWAVDSDGSAYWYRDEPTFDYDGDNTYGIAGVWLRPRGDDRVWLRLWETGESGGQFDNNSNPGMNVKFDATWPPEGFDDWVIDWDKTLRSRP
jgi:hypothetical protein